MPEKYQENLDDAIRSLKIADHMAYVTFPLVGDRRLLLKIFDEIYKTVINCVNAVLNYECLYKRIRLYSDNGNNLHTFMRVGKNYGLSHEQIKRIGQVIELNRRHKQSPMEFVKKEKVVIMSNSLGTDVLDVRLIKEYLLLAKELLMRVNKKVGG